MPCSLQQDNIWNFCDKHYKFLNLHEDFSLLSHLNKKNEMLTNLDVQKLLQNAIPMNEYLEIL